MLTSSSIRRLLLAQGLVVIATSAAAERPYVHTGDAQRPSTISESIGDAPAAAAAREQNRQWPAPIGENFGTPAFYDLQGDGVMEVIAVDRHAVYVFDASASLLPGWPRNIGEVNNSPAVGDIDEDGAPEILVSTAGAPPKIHCLNVDGSEQAGFPVSLPYQYWLNVSAPAVADVDGDGHLDVGAQSEPGVAFFDRFGAPLPGWPYLWSTQQNIVWSAPAVADLDGDGRTEVVVGNNNLYACGVHVIRFDGKPMLGWPRPTRNIFSSAAVGDLDGDGDLEIVIQEGDPTWYGGYMHVWHHDGSYLPGWPRLISDEWECSRSNPAIADVDNNGTLEIVTATGDARLHILNIGGTEFPSYPHALPGGSISSVQVIDIDDDGIEEMFLCYWSGGSQWVCGWRLNGAILAGFPKLLYSGSQLEAHSSTHLADLDGDGDLDLCAQGGTFGAGNVWVYEVDGSHYDPDVSRSDWPKIRRDMHNTGYYPRAEPVSVAAILPAGMRLSCSPNPARIGQTVRLDLPGGASGRLSVFDPAGRAVGMLETEGGRAVFLPLDDLLHGTGGPGVYFLRWAPSFAEPPAAARLVLVAQ